TPYLKKPPFHLSSGEKQKVCLASLLVLEPELLLLDEPASNLDPLATGWLVDFLGELEETVIITTHNLSLSTELGKRSLVLSRDHRLIYDGDLKDFLTDADKLIEAHLMHTHKHKHGQRYHKHFHIHDWD
ncbi:MAG TPA: ATP-binding cassette domain-containing protein, partial [Bacteroidetes bacterium]|nr:ATP-binding cassette domain-containing protein [Bacteroidota bacterium]